MTARSKTAVMEPLVNRMTTWREGTRDKWQADDTWRHLEDTWETLGDTVAGCPLRRVVLSPCFVCLSVLFYVFFIMSSLCLFFFISSSSFFFLFVIGFFFLIFFLSPCFFFIYLLYFLKWGYFFTSSSSFFLVYMEEGREGEKWIEQMVKRI